MSFSILGKTAIVTGAANGIGLSIARHFADQGANVMCADMDKARLDDELGSQLDEGNMRYFAGDLRQRLTIANLISATIDAFDQVDILVNASRQVMKSDVMDVDDSSVEVLLEQNMLTSLRLSQQVAKRMIKQAKDQQNAGPAGTIVNFSSIAARQTCADLMGYSIASAAVEQMTRTMALALAPSHIRVNAVAFGSVMSASLQRGVNDHPDWRSEIESKTPLGRIAGPMDMASTVQFLASEASGFMTGEIVTVDGGRSLLDTVTAPVH